MPQIHTTAQQSNPTANPINYKKWTNDINYFWAHGHDIGDDYTSAKCRYPI